MPPENTQEQVVDRGDNLDEPKTTATTQELPADTGNLDDDVAAVVGDAAAGTETDEKETETAKERNDKGQFIPKERFDAAVQRERAEKERVAARLQELEKREADRAVSQDLQQASAKIKDLIKEHTQMLSDGELDKASQTMEQIIQLQSDMADRRSQAYADQGRSQAKSEIQYDAVVARLEMEYPEINPENTEAFDREAVRRVQAYMTGLMQMDNMTPSKALQEAVSTILGAKRAEENQTEDTKRKAAEDLGMRRKESAVAKAVEAQGKQPANLKDVGKDHDKEGGPLDAAAVMKMSWDEFIKLPEERLSQMRGDHIS